MCRNFVRLSLSLRNTRIRFIVSMKYCFRMSNIFNYECIKTRSTFMRKGSILYVHMYVILVQVHTHIFTHINKCACIWKWMIKAPNRLRYNCKSPQNLLSTIYDLRVSVCICLYVVCVHCTHSTLTTKNRRIAYIIVDYTLVYTEKSWYERLRTLCMYIMYMYYVSLSMFSSDAKYRELAEI